MLGFGVGFVYRIIPGMIARTVMRSGITPHVTINYKPTSVQVRSTQSPCSERKDHFFLDFKTTLGKFHEIPNKKLGFLVVFFVISPWFSRDFPMAKVQFDPALSALVMSTTCNRWRHEGAVKPWRHGSVIPRRSFIYLKFELLPRSLEVVFFSHLISYQLLQHV